MAIRTNVSSNPVVRYAAVVNPTRPSAMRPAGSAQQAMQSATKVAANFEIRVLAEVAEEEHPQVLLESNLGVQVVSQSMSFSLLKNDIPKV